MFVNIRAAAHGAPAGPTREVLGENQDARVLLLTLAAAQALPDDTSASTVILTVISGRGVIRIGETMRPVAAGDLALCPPSVAHAVAAAKDEPLVVLAVVAPRP